MLSLQDLEKQNILHVYNRGNRKELIGHNLDDFDYFSKLINYQLNFNMFEILCLCIMPNHFHILTIQKGNVTIGSVMQKIGMVYTKYVNKKYGYCGHLFQSAYKYKTITHPDQFRIVYRYILKNPENAGLKTTKPWLEYNKFLADYYLINFPGNK